jgi:hypothetical protein
MFGSRGSICPVLKKNFLLFLQGVNKRIPFPDQGEPKLSLHDVRIDTSPIAS